MKKIRVSTLREKKAAGERIVCLTAHDAITARWAELGGADMILVGDSLGMTSLGRPTTLEVTLDMMIHHASAVTRGASGPLLVGDMPFMTYKVSVEQALASCARMIQEGGMEAVKIEGGAEMAPTVERLVNAGIPVMAHIGLLPQSVHAQGGYRVQGKSEADAARLENDGAELERAGAFCVVLEAMPSPIAGRISRALVVPTIGIGAGVECDGQVLVIADLLGMTPGKLPKFARRYADFHKLAVEGVGAYAADVRAGDFPGPEQVYS